LIHYSCNIQLGELNKYVTRFQLFEKFLSMAVILKSGCFFAGPDPPHGYSDSSDMVRTILQTVQNQDRVLKDLYTPLR